MELGKTNLLERSHVQGFKDMLAKSVDGSSVKALVLRSDGKDFTRGLRQRSKSPNPRSGNRKRPSAETASSPFDRCPLGPPLIVAVNGRCDCAGVDLSLMADVVVAGVSATFSHPGFDPERGEFSVRGYNRRKTAHALAPLLASGRFSSDEAFRHRLVDEVTKDGREFDRACDLAFMFAECPPLAICELLARRALPVSGQRRPFT